MLMSRSQDSSTPLIGKASSGRFSGSSSLFQKASPQMPNPPSSYPSTQYLSSSHMETITYSKLSSQPLEASAFKDFANTGSATLSYRQMRGQGSSHPVSYVPVLDYQNPIQVNFLFTKLFFC